MQEGQQLVSIRIRSGCPESLIIKSKLHCHTCQSQASIRAFDLPLIPGGSSLASSPDHGNQDSIRQIPDELTHRLRDFAAGQRIPSRLRGEACEAQDCKSRLQIYAEMLSCLFLSLSSHLATSWLFQTETPNDPF